MSHFPLEGTDHFDGCRTNLFIAIYLKGHTSGGPRVAQSIKPSDS